MKHHSIAAFTVLSAAVLDTVAGAAFSAAEHISLGNGLYWAVATATTVGYGDIIPRTTAGHVIAVLVMLTVIPLFAATFSLFTSGLTSINVSNSEERIKRHIDLNGRSPDDTQD